MGGRVKANVAECLQNWESLRFSSYSNIRTNRQQERLRSLWTEKVALFYTIYKLCNLFPKDSLNPRKLFLDGNCLARFLCGYFTECWNPNTVPPAEGSLSHKYFRARRIFERSLGYGFLQLLYFPLVSQETGLDGVQSDIVWPFFSGK